MSDDISSGFNGSAWGNSSQNTDLYGNTHGYDIHNNWGNNDALGNSRDHNGHGSAPSEIHGIASSTDVWGPHHS